MRKEKKFTAVSNTVWVDLKAMVTEKTIKEESTDKNYSNDNYSASITVLPYTRCSALFAYKYLQFIVFYTVSKKHKRRKRFNFIFVCDFFAAVTIDRYYFYVRQGVVIRKSIGQFN